jgi:hypothetical protein
MRKLIVTSLMVFACFLLPAHAADRPDFTPPVTPEEFVREFYQWYFKADAGRELAEYNDEIYLYVAKETVDTLRKKKGGSNLYYFTKIGQSFNPERIQTIVHQATHLDEIFIIPITFDDSSDKYDAIVIVKNINGRFYIHSVMDIYPDIL